jgi:hypothetical protein
MVRREYSVEEIDPRILDLTIPEIKRMQTDSKHDAEEADDILKFWGGSIPVGVRAHFASISS